MAIRKRKNETFREYIRRGNYAHMLEYSRKIPKWMCIDDNLKGIHREMLTLIMAFARNGENVVNRTKNIAGILNLDTEQEVIDAQRYLVEKGYMSFYNIPGEWGDTQCIRLLNNNQPKQSAPEVTIPSDVNDILSLF